MITYRAVLAGPVFDDPGPVVQAITAEHVEDAANLFSRLAKDAAPVLTGLMKSEIVIEAAGDDVAVVAMADYSTFVQDGYHRGSRWIPGRDFFFVGSDEAQAVLDSTADDVVRALD